MRWTEIHYGKEKYAGENAGKTVKRTFDANGAEVITVK